MRRLVPVAVSVLVVGLVSGSAAADDNGDDKNGDLTLYATETSSTAEDEEPVEGESFTIVDTLYSDADREDEVGRNDISCTVTEVSDGEEFVSVLCHGVVTLDDEGTLAWQGSAQFEGSEEGSEDEPFITVAVTGGTGDFVDAGGEVEIFDDESTDEETRSRYEVDLS